MTHVSLREQLTERESILRLMGAHSALSARLAETAGFDGIWASSLEVSAVAGVADDEQITDRVLLAVQEMSGVAGCPIVVDCAGGPALSKMADFVSDFEDAGAAGLCFEDARSPKVNSLRNAQQKLEPVDVFGEKIAKACQSRTCRETCIIARVESLIAGTGQRDALQRAETYAAAGADAILIHSKASAKHEILAFVSSWRRPEPLVIVPSTYVDLTLSDVRASGRVGMVIYANQGLRSAVAAFQDTFARILRDETTFGVEPSLTPLADLFELQDDCIRRREGYAELSPGVDQLVEDRV